MEPAPRETGGQVFFGTRRPQKHGFTGVPGRGAQNQLSHHVTKNQPKGQTNDSESDEAPGDT